MTATLTSPPFVLTQVEATHVERLSPSFVRAELASPALADFGVDGPLYDQRVKLVFPPASGVLPAFAADESWYPVWAALPDHERGHMRTYTVRELRGAGADTRLVVDFVLHEGHGRSGPGSAWAARAVEGDRLVLLGPRRGHPWGGIEFEGAGAETLLLVGDETAVPAVAGILDGLGPDARGSAFLEVPCAGDIQPLAGPPGVEVTWLVRGAAAHGVPLTAAVRGHLGLDPVAEALDEAKVDPDLWETGSYSSSGESLEVGPIRRTDLPGLYAWIAGEAKTVTALRRMLVSEFELDRRQVAFMGYWRDGVAMKS
jgi:NADPH-dependent ferric siderophore reductase